MDKMQQGSWQRLKQSIEFPGYRQLQTSLIKTLNDLGVDSGVMTVINNDDNPREAGKARASFTFRRRGRGIEVEAFGIKGELWPEEDFKAWWKKALAGEKTQFNLNYGFFAFRLSDVGPKLSVAKRAEQEHDGGSSEADPVAQRAAMPPAPSEEAITADGEETESIPVSGEEIAARFASIHELQRGILDTFNRERPDVQPDRRAPCTLYLYPVEAGEIVGEGYPLIHPSIGARTVKVKIGGSTRPLYGPGAEKSIREAIADDGIHTLDGLVVTRQRFEE